MLFDKTVGRVGENVNKGVSNGNNTIGRSGHGVYTFFGLIVKLYLCYIFWQSKINQNKHRMSAKNKKSRRQAPSRETVVHAALGLAAEQPWQDITLVDIARHAGIKLHELRGFFDDKADILGAFGGLVDRRVMARWSADPDSSPRDRLFDLLMERFECLEDHRAGLTSVLKSFRLDPKQALIALPHLCRSMSWMLEAAAIGTSGLQGALRVAGLTALYVHVLKTWMEDDGADLAKTMAALDRDLGHVENWSQKLGL